ncbi:MAG: single-stranded DNA-binding protein [candidate division Zixibacteria bacterium]
MGSTRLPNLNKVMIVGNLTRDPELRSTTTGVPVANFRIASNRRFKDSSGDWKEDVCYIGVVAWQKLAESCAAMLKKGSAVYVEGELRSRNMDNDSGSKRSSIEIRAHHIQFLDKCEKFDEESKDSENNKRLESNDGNEEYLGE